MNNTFNTLQDVYKASYFWYSKVDIDSLYPAKGRLMRGDTV